MLRVIDKMMQKELAIQHVLNCVGNALLTVSTDMNYQSMLDQLYIRLAKGTPIVQTIFNIFDRKEIIKSVMNDAGWVLGTICSKHLIEPMNMEKVIYIGKVLLNAGETRHEYEGLGIIETITCSNHDDIIRMVCTDNTIPKLCNILLEYQKNTSVLDRCLIAVANITTTNSSAIIAQFMQNDLASKLHMLLQSQEDIGKEAIKIIIFTLSNLVADNQEVADVVLQDTGLVDELMELGSHPCIQVRSECLMTLCVMI